MTSSGGAEIPRQINLALSFILELLMLAAVGYWGYSLRPDLPGKLFLAVLGPVFLAVTWGFFFAPTARRRLPMPWLLIGKLVLFGGSVVALHMTDRSNLAWPFAGLIGINFAFVILWKQY